MTLLEFCAAWYMFGLVIMICCAWYDYIKEGVLRVEDVQVCVLAAFFGPLILLFMVCCFICQPGHTILLEKKHKNEKGVL